MVIPVHNDSGHLTRCLDALMAGTARADEIVIVDDGSEWEVEEWRTRPGCRLIRREHAGSFAARNAGAAEAAGDVVVFLDSDVEAEAGTIERIVERFERDRELDALFGAYDDAPGSEDFVSQFRNLLHAYTHGRGRERAATFWTGCGAVRRSVFAAFGGFALDRRCLRDVELGMRMARAGRKIRLDKTLRVKHWKRWRFGELVRTDVFDRAANWTEMMLRQRFAPNDLNVRTGERWAVGLLGAAGVAAMGAMARPGWLGLAGALGVGYLTCNRGLLAYLARVKGRWFAMRAVPLVVSYHVCCAVGLGVGVGRWVRGVRPVRERD